jgi:hypothetical protein
MLTVSTDLLSPNITWGIVWAVPGFITEYYGVVLLAD